MKGVGHLAVRWVKLLARAMPGGDQLLSKGINDSAIEIR